MQFVDGEANIEDIEAFLARLEAISDEHGGTVQAFDARYVVDSEHLERALEFADRAIARGEAIARDRAVEILLYAAGRRQINRALEMGVSTGECPVVVLVDGGDETGAATRLRDLLGSAETLGAYDRDRVMDFFDVTHAELDTTSGTLADLVHERVALLSIER